ncbi:Hypothetical protein LUCI_1130 [Lucifera butyrica]|uniref:4Fe-4S ferredoxin-type domain-containing protein n=1 Tax=Lucifera butyrica TaxID=1351585 RepID=A0A498R437_9FIRM|nr:Hypothetical protein LUCI_1130 [Lucifera butyrica]
MFVVTVDSGLCQGCGECAKGCPVQMFTVLNGKAQVSEDECLGCQSCVSLCTVGAISVDEY